MPVSAPHRRLYPVRAFVALLALVASATPAASPTWGEGRRVVAEASAPPFVIDLAASEFAP